MDADPLFQPEGTYRFALNANLEIHKGLLGNISSEESNIQCGVLPEDFLALGSHCLSDSSIILFGVDRNQTLSSILRYRPNSCEVETIMQSNDLNFKTAYGQIDCISRLIKGCEWILYFTDGNNVYRSININRLEAYVNDGFSTIPTNGLPHPNTDPANGWDIKKLNFFPEYSIPSFTNVEVIDSGGKQKVGVNEYCIRYLDDLLNPTPWMAFTRPVNIINEPSTSIYHLRQGAVNKESLTDGGVNETSKAVKLYIDNIDTTYKYFQIGVICSNASLGISSTAYILEEYEILNNSSIVFTHTGFSNQIYAQVAVEELVVPSANLNTVKHHAIINDRLILANTTEKTYDWTTFQKYASKIVTNWITKPKDRMTFDFDPCGDPCTDSTCYTNQDESYLTDTVKDPIYYFEDASFMRDEVEAFGIVYIMSNGQESPVFHIPGRAQNKASYSNAGTIIDLNNIDLITDGNTNPHYRNQPSGTDNWDTQLLTVVTSAPSSSEVLITDVKHLGFLTVSDDIGYGAGLVPRWRVFNTAVRTSYTTDWQTTFGANYGVMGYHENLNSYYPKIEICSENDYWGSDYWGNDLVNTPIRHHRLPDATLEPHYYNQNIASLGITFSNIQIPEAYADEIVGYKIVRAVKTNEDKTVIQKGLLYNAATYNVIDNVGQYKYISEPLPLHAPYLSGEPNMAFVPVGKSDLQDGTNIWSASSVDTEINMTNTDLQKYFCFTSPEHKFNNSSLGGSYVKYELKIDFELREYGDLSGGGDAHYNITQAFTNEPTSPDLPSDFNRKINASFNLEPNTVLPSGVGTENIPIEMSNTYHTIIIGELEDPMERLDSGGDADIDDTDVEDCPHRQGTYAWYVSIKQDKDVFSFLDKIEYVPMHNTVEEREYVDLYGGTIFIGDLHYKRNLAYGYLLAQFSGPPMGSFPATVRSVVGFCVESEINVQLRHSYLNDIYSYYYPRDFPLVGHKGWVPFLYLDDADTSFLFYNSLMTPILFDNDLRSHKSVEQFNYNKDYSKLNSDKKYFPLSFNYDHCCQCNNVHTNRLWYSEQSFSEDQIDMFRVIKANNYKDYFPEDGVITNLFVDKDNLYMSLENSLCLLPTKPYQLQTQEGNIQVGTGDFLNLPVKRLVTLDHSYIGSTDKWATKVTEFGTAIIDQKSSKIFLLSREGGVEELGSQSMYNWLSNNVSVSFLTQFRDLVGIDYPMYSNSVDQYGVGITTTYDPRYKRLIIHKKDFEFDDSEVSLTLANTGEVNPLNSVVWEPIQQCFGVVTGYDGSGYPTINRISFTSSYFKNKSWTLSYSFSIKAFASFHSYMPNLMFNDSSTFYSIINTFEYVNGVSELIFKHNYPSTYLYFYNYVFPHVVDFICNQQPNIEKYFNGLSYIGDTFKISATNNQEIFLKDSTYTNVVFYNKNQISLDHLIINKNYDPYFSPHNEQWIGPTGILVGKTDNYWRINSLRDYAIDRDLQLEPLFTSDYTVSQLSNYYNTNTGQGYMDKVVNPNAVSTTKNVYQRERFKHKWLGVRLMYYTEDIPAGITLSLNSINTNTSNR